MARTRADLLEGGCKVFLRTGDEIELGVSGPIRITIGSC